MTEEILTMEAKFLSILEGEGGRLERDVIMVQEWLQGGGPIQSCLLDQPVKIPCKS